MRGFGFAALAFGVFIALVAGVIGYNMGIGANIAAQTGGTVVYPAMHWGWGFGFGGIFGFFLFILLLFLIFGLVRRAIWGGRGGWGHHGWYGRGWYGHDHDMSGKDVPPVPPMANEMFQRWHEQMHGQSTGSGQSGQSSQPTDKGSGPTATG